MPPTDHELRAQLMRFGAPLFVPAGSWWVAGVEHSNGVADGVLVFGGEGEVVVRTESIERGPTPISIRVRNVQAATVNSPDWQTRSRWDQVIVEEAERDVLIEDAPTRVRVMVSYACFSFETVVADRIVSAAGELPALDALRIERLDELVLRSKDRC